MNNFFAFLTAKKKPLLIIGGTILLLFLLYFGGLRIMENYLEKNVYPDMNLIFYEEAQSALDKTWFSFGAKAFLALADKINPSLFVHSEEIVNTYDKYRESFDYVKSPATFKIVSSTPEDKTLSAGLSVEFILPSIMKGLITDAAVICSPATTRALETRGFSDEQIEGIIKQKSSSGEVYQEDWFFKPLAVDEPIYDFIVNLLARDDVKNGSRTVQLRARCTTPLCDFVGPECEINVF